MIGRLPLRLREYLQMSDRCVQCTLFNTQGGLFSSSPSLKVDIIQIWEWMR